MVIALAWQGKQTISFFLSYYDFIFFFAVRCGEVCSYVAGLLFKVRACVLLEIAKQIGTSLPSVWNQAYSKTAYFNLFLAIVFTCYFNPSTYCVLIVSIATSGRDLPLTKCAL